MELLQFKQTPSPVRLVTRPHVTVVADDVLESVGAQLGHTALAVYVVLERHANAEGRCWPSQEAIAGALKITPRWVRDAVAKLSEAGFIKVHKRSNRFGLQTSDEYELPFHPRTDGAEEPAERPAEAPPEVFCPNTSAKVVPEVVASSREETPPSPPKRKTRQPATETEEFIAFYQAYPRHQGRADAWRAWQNLDPDAEMAVTLMESLHRLIPEYRRRPPDKVPLPATWLNGGRWTDEPTKEVSSVRTTPNGNRIYNSSDLAEMVRNGGSNGSNRDDEAFVDSFGRLVQ